MSVHLIEESPIGFVQNTVYFERFEVIMYNQVSWCFKTTGSDHSECSILSGYYVQTNKQTNTKKSFLVTFKS